MPNGNELNAELEFEQKMLGMSDRALSEFTARAVFEMKQEQSQLALICSQVPLNDKRITALEGGSKKASAISGGIAGTVLAIIIGLIEFFTNK